MYIVSFFCAELLPPSLLEAVEVGTTSIVIRWTQDEVVTGYILDITYNGPCTPNSQTMFLDGSLRSYTITGLEEGSSYTIELSALNGAGRSEGSRLENLFTTSTCKFSCFIVYNYKIYVLNMYIQLYLIIVVVQLLVPPQNPLDPRTLTPL